MINQNELRIWNMVIRKNAEGVSEEIIIERGRDIENNANYHPIPLTFEWLERCGLERLPLGKYMIDGNWHLRVGDCIIAYDDRPSFVEGNFSYIGFRIPKQILYLHQLQNLYFALTGEELTIK